MSKPDSAFETFKNELKAAHDKQRESIMAQACPAAAQPALDVSASPASRPLTFFNSRNGRCYMATFQNHVFAIHRHDCTDRVIWGTTIVEIGCGHIGSADAFAELGAAIDYLQGEAARMGGGS